MKHFRVLAIGVFDLFHVGHLRYLQYVGARAEQLFVVVAPDTMCFEVKGKWPVICEANRLEIIRGLGWVDRVELQPVSTTWPGPAADWMLHWGITHVIAGGGWRGSERWRILEAELRLRGISVDFAPDTQSVSTTKLIASIRRESLVD